MRDPHGPVALASIKTVAAAIVPLESNQEKCAVSRTAAGTYRVTLATPYLPKQVVVATMCAGPLYASVFAWDAAGAFFDLKVKTDAGVDTDTDQLQIAVWRIIGV